MSQRRPLVNSALLNIGQRLVASLIQLYGEKWDFQVVYQSTLALVVNLRDPEFADYAEALKRHRFGVLVVAHVRADKFTRARAAEQSQDHTKKWNRFFPVVTADIEDTDDPQRTAKVELADRCGLYYLHLDPTTDKTATISLPPDCSPAALQAKWLDDARCAIAVNDWHYHLFAMLRELTTDLAVAIEPLVSALIGIEKPQELDPNSSAEDWGYLEKARVDVAICTPGNVAWPLIAIESDGDPHRDDLTAVRNDKTKNKAFRDSPVSLVRVRTSDGPAWTESPAKQYNYFANLIALCQGIIQFAELKQQDPILRKERGEFIRSRLATLRDPILRGDLTAEINEVSKQSANEPEDDSVIRTDDTVRHHPEQYEEIDGLNVESGMIEAGQRGPLSERWAYISPPPHLQQQGGSRHTYWVHLKLLSHRSDSQPIFRMDRKFPQVKVIGLGAQQAYRMINDAFAAQLFLFAEDSVGPKAVDVALKADLIRRMRDMDATEFSNLGWNRAVDKIRGRVASSLQTFGKPQESIHQELIELSTYSSEEKELLRLALQEAISSGAKPGFAPGYVKGR